MEAPNPKHNKQEKKKITFIHPVNLVFSHQKALFAKAVVKVFDIPTL